MKFPSTRFDLHVPTFPYGVAGQAREHPSHFVVVVVVAVVAGVVVAFVEVLFASLSGEVACP